MSETVSVNSALSRPGGHVHAHSPSHTQNTLPSRVNPLTNQCEYFESGACTSCTLMPIAHEQQVRAAQAALEGLIADASPSPAGQHIQWLPPIVSEPWSFRTKAKMAVSGSANAPVFAFPGAAGTSDVSATGAGPASAAHETAETPADLADCPLYPQLVTEVLESVRTLIRRAQIPPYRVEKRRGEIKYVLVTASDTEALVRLVLRSESALDRIREHVGVLDPRVVSVSANIHPEHSALLEGERDVHVSGADRLYMRAGGVTLGVLPRSFTQTNSAVAGDLYRQVAAWIVESGATSVWDLYCGVGGFALNIAAAGAGLEASASCETQRQSHADLRVHGVEVTRAAVLSAQESAERMGLDPEKVQFTAADATQWALAQEPSALPDAIVVNPPRRGIGETLATWLNGHGPRIVVYSSCNPTTLAADLALMSAYRVTRGRLVDMFPHTAHNEAVVLLERH